IYYESTNKERDSIVILGIDSLQKEESGWLMAKSAYNTQWVSIQHPLTWNSINAVCCVKHIDTINNEGIIYISKYPQTEEVNFSFYFKNFYSYWNNEPGEPAADSITINGLILTNYYVVKNHYKERDTAATDIAELYWTEKGG